MSSARDMLKSDIEIAVKTEETISPPDRRHAKNDSFSSATTASEVSIFEVTLECKNLSVTVQQRKDPEPIKLLDSIDAVFKPGTITAIMGPSGAGKTTFMNILGGRSPAHLKVASDSLHLNGEPFTAYEVRQVSSLVPQNDILFAMLTPRETFEYAARLTLNISKKQVKTVVQSTLKQLSLLKSADVICGDEDDKGISGGERKRVSIGLEMITNPSCLFLDEPTSGLDSKVSMDVISILQKLAKQGRTIICTIHQPSYPLFKQFDRLVLLYGRGKLAFQGEIGDVPDYFSSIGQPLAPYENPADHILNVVSAPNFDIQFFGFQQHGNLFVKKAIDYLAISESTKSKKSKTEILELKEKHKLSSAFKTWIIFLRSTYITVKDSRQLRTRVGQVIVFSILVGFTYFQLNKKQTSSFDRQSMFLICMMFNVMLNMIATVIAIPREKTMLKREHSNAFFGTGSFFWARLITYWLFQAFYTAVFAAIAYYCVGLQPTADKFFIFVAVNILCANIAVTLGFCAGTVFPTVAQATAVVPLLIVPMVLFSGLLLSFDNIPVYFIWVYYISFMQYYFQILVINEFEGFHFDPCTIEELTTPGQCPFGPCNTGSTSNASSVTVAIDLHEESFDESSDNFIFSTIYKMLQKSSSAIIQQPESCPGELLLDSKGYDLENEGLGFNFGILFAYWAFAVILSYIALARFLRPNN